MQKKMIGKHVPHDAEWVGPCWFVTGNNWHETGINYLEQGGMVVLPRLNTR